MINETGDTTELTMSTKNSKSKSRFGDDEDETVDEKKVDPTNPEAIPPQHVQDQTFKPMESNPPPPTAEELAAADPANLPPMSEKTKAEIEAGRAAVGTPPLPTPEHPDGGVGEGDAGATRRR
jgi:hypothetical protein